MLWDSLPSRISCYSDKPQFWDSLYSLASAHSESWLLIGDSYYVASQDEKRDGHPFSSSSAGGLSHFINSCGLVDMGFYGNSFTWNNRRGGCANIRESLTAVL